MIEALTHKKYIKADIQFQEKVPKAENDDPKVVQKGKGNHHGPVITQPACRVEHKRQVASGKEENNEHISITYLAVACVKKNKYIHRYNLYMTLKNVKIYPNYCILQKLQIKLGKYFDTCLNIISFFSVQTLCTCSSVLCIVQFVVYISIIV